jgi:formylglycine-generating enzyme required for sulfatase activity
MFEFFGAVAGALAIGAPVVRNLGEIALGGRRMLDFAGQILDCFRKKVPPEKEQAVIRLALSQAAALPQAEFDKKAEEIVGAALPGEAPEQRKAATEFLKLFPARIRATLIRPEDPSGTTVPARFSIDRSEDLRPFIPPRPPRFKTGDHPDGAPKFTLIDRLAIGGMGEVWTANTKSMPNTLRVFKFCLDPVSQKHFFENEVENIELVQNELKDHPHIVNLLDAHLEGETPWLLYDYIPGGHLGQLIPTWPDDTEQRAATAVQTLITLADTLSLCHNQIVQNGKPKKVIHRDMKPANVLVGKHNTLKITDFGISNTQARHAIDQAKLATVSGMTMSTTGGFLVAGTPLYAPDQQFDPAWLPHPADDVHALGVMLYQMILRDVNRPLNRDYRAILERLKICPQLIELVSRGIASDVKDRFQHAGELADALRSLPKKLVVLGVPPQEAEKEKVKQLYAEIDQKFAEAERKNSEARQLFHGRKWKQAKEVMDGIFHPKMHDKELYKSICLYAEGKRLKNSLGMEFALVPRGDSWLGGGGGNPGTKKFNLEEDLWCGIYPVTQAEWQAVMGGNPSKFSGNPRFPVEQVSWEAITNSFLPKLNEKCKADGYLYRLPTEDEWEYICRGGPISQDQSKFHYYFAKSKTDLTANATNELTRQMACFGQDGNGRPGDVGSYLPNPLNIYDMHGLVWEWTSSAVGSLRVNRGGSWNNDAEYCTATDRSASSPGDALSGLGFRVLAVPLVR